MTRTIAFLNQKGGVGKSTAVTNVGAGLALAGRRVVVVDLDPQAHLTYGLGIAAHELEVTIHDVLRGDQGANRALLSRGDFRLIPSCLDLSGAELELASIPGRELLLKEALSAIQDVDFVLLDCPPSLGLLTLNALTASREVFIPFQAEYLALQGMSRLVQTIDIVRRRLNPTLEITGVVATRYDRRKNLNREVVEKVADHFGPRLFATRIRDAIAIAEAPGFGKTIFEYRPGSSGADDYRSLCSEILERGELPQ